MYIRLKLIYCKGFHKNSFEIYNSIISLLLAKIESGEEKEITKQQVEAIPYYFLDDNGLPGAVAIPTSLKNKLTANTIKEIELLHYQS